MPPTLRGPRTARVESLQRIKEGSYATDFSGIETIDDAEQLVGRYCLIARADMPDVDPQDAPVTLIGYAVIDEQEGSLGLVDQVMASSAQSVLVVEGDRGQVMIPFVDAFVLDVDDDAQRIRTRIPSGLIGLANASAAETGRARGDHRNAFHVPRHV